jgi:hypothetical protein
VNIHRTAVRMWTAAVDLATTIRTDLTTTTTGRRWRRAPVECPAWCGRGHLCSAQHGYPSGQHRPAPAVFGTGYGSLVASRVATGDGTNRVELRLTVSLPRDEQAAGQLAQAVLTGTHLLAVALSTRDHHTIASTSSGRRLPGGVG